MVPAFGPPALLERHGAKRFSGAHVLKKDPRRQGISTEKVSKLSAAWTRIPVDA
jgi:hypothetical protein